MANFLIVVDPDAERRTAFVRSARPRLAPLPGLAMGGADLGDLAVLWAAGARAPVQCHAAPDGASVIWGEAVTSGGQRLTAPALLARWSGPSPERSEPLAGFHAAMAWSASGDLVVGGDVLGLFPVYHWTDGQTVLVGSSPELFALHPRVHTGLDRPGLVGLMLLGGLAEGRTLWRGVQRLAPGHLVCARAGAACAERTQFDPRPDTRHFDLPWSAQRALYTETLAAAVRRHAGTEACGVLLSGGRDSRMLAGFMKGARLDAVALTLGVDADIEMQCARGVARALGFPHRTASVEPGRYPECAERAVSWEHLAGGLGNPTNWGLQPALDALPARLFSGYTMDAVVGGSHISWALDAAARAMSADALFRRVNSGAVPRPVLETLVRSPDFAGAVEDVADCLRARYRRSADFEFQRAWRFDLEHRQRFHVGRSLWPLSFSSWPVVPCADPEVIRMAGGLPASSLAERHLQDTVLCESFPALAALPLDTNSYRHEPLQPTLTHRVKSVLAAGVARRHWRLQRLLDGAPRRRGEERRYYFRIYDIDGPGWRAVRRQAEPFRERLRDVFDGDALDAYLPGPETSLQLANGINDAAGRKLLIGLMLWSRAHWEARPTGAR